MCSLRASTSHVLSSTHVLFIYLYQCLEAVPVKKVKTVLSTSSMYRLAAVGDPGEPIAQPFCQ